MHLDLIETGGSKHCNWGISWRGNAGGRRIVLTPVGAASASAMRRCSQCTTRPARSSDRRRFSRLAFWGRPSFISPFTICVMNCVLHSGQQEHQLGGAGTLAFTTMIILGQCMGMRCNLSDLPEHCTSCTESFKQHTITCALLLAGLTSEPPAGSDKFLGIESRGLDLFYPISIIFFQLCNSSMKSKSVDPRHLLSLHAGLNDLHAASNRARRMGAGGQAGHLEE